MFFRRRLPNTTTLIFIIGGFLLLTVMLKHLYDNNQKCIRIKNYEQLMQEISDHMQSVESAANKSGTNLHHLNTVLIQEQRHHSQQAIITQGVSKRTEYVKRLG